jgi:Flp pilus assembly protein TadG
MRNRRGARRRGSSGQSVVEFAILLPVLLALAGATSDFARLYQQDISLSAATRDAAEYIATNTSKTVTTANAGSTAADLLNAQLSGLGTFTSVSTLTCTSPQVAVNYSSSSSATGATTKYPLGSAVVQACVPFQTLFAYPFVPSGQLTISTAANYAVLQNR